MIGTQEKPRTHRRAPKAPTKVCSAPDCWGKTRAGKPYCLEHIELNPYALLVAGRARAIAAGA